ncbi:hypothetical protein AURDEDRAFT_130407 [Auricularia subglabra TFB-10046 SS5]|uniref:Uncharacterized protein n=1 Tax=Auricularia subglabra (strain TFB-10046 / SS5) TaxID=717982 RepID=J0D8M5_AURST|nr:hypothetical protein AURDEDRAFT_130407 [Auricularia subglabra TFB-10046 SS5]
MTKAGRNHLAYFERRTPYVVGDLPRINVSLMHRRVYVKAWVQHAIRTVQCVHEVINRLQLMQAIYEGIGGLMLHELGAREMPARKKRIMWGKINRWFADYIVFFESATSLCYGACEVCVHGT